MGSIFFFEKKKISLDKVFKEFKNKKNFSFNDIKPLHSAKKNDISFFDSLKYKDQAYNTKAGICLTTEKLKKFLPEETEKIIVKNVLLELSKLLRKVYPLADKDYPDISLKSPKKTNFRSVKFGNNVLIGKKVKIGKNTLIGSNTII